ncbi:DUF2523 family protein [Alkanindiges sp. WGS2144]|uniref:DUF2523 family protein n=1 Tax=Alkanindiges sp. WGS2144 TaxID=3366808 RepID=UPI00375381D6
MGKLLFLVGQLLLGSAVKRMLLGAGLGLMSSQIILTIVRQFINQGLSGLFSNGGVVLSFLGLSGCDVALSVLIGAVIARATINSMGLTLKKV